jgi:hypothetical protein
MHAMMISEDLEAETSITWLTACDELESVLKNVKTSLDLVALTHLTDKMGNGTNAVRTESESLLLQEVTQQHDASSLTTPTLLQSSCVRPLCCRRLSVATSSIYSIPDSYALENARLTEPFSPDCVPPEFWSESDEESSPSYSGHCQCHCV